MDGSGAVKAATIFDSDLFQLAQRAFEVYPEASRFEDFGPYAIERALGKGGMGEVFLAHDRTAERPVAIKFLYNLWSAPGIEERFTREIQHLAKLEHPFIARLYDAGIHPCGAPYFAMEFVAGEPLDNYCRERESSIGIRLQLFSLVCQAVGYAHTRLIVHCDLKPSNILVENDGMLKVVDFGVSRKLVALDEPASQGQSITGFTAVFAAPEQIRGENIGLYTDVYSLGVVLYQLITGTLPGNANSPSDAERFLLSDREPEKPSTAGRKRATNSGLSKSAWADLDVLCLKALKKDPAQRYGTVLELTQDLERYQSGKPLKARPDSIRYRLGKFVRRNRVPVFATASAVVLIASLVTFFTLRLARERDRANLETAAATAMNSFLADDLLGQANPFQSGTSQQTLISAVSQAAPRIDAQFASQPLVAARLHRAIAEALDSRADFAGARPEYLRAEHLFQKVEGSHSQDAIALAIRRAALESRVSTAPNLALSKSTLAGAEASLAQISHARVDLDVRIKYARGLIAVAGNDFPAANREFAAALSEALVIPSFPRRDLLRVKESYAFSCNRTGNSEQAEKLLREAIAGYRAMGENESPSILHARIYVAQALLLQNLYSKAITEANAIYPAVIQKLGPTHEMTYVLLGTRAAAAGSLGMWTDSIRDDTAMLKIITLNQGPNSTLAAQALADMALSQCRSGESVVEGESNARRALNIAKANSGARSAMAGAVSYSLLTCLCLNGKLDEAVAVLNTIDVPAVTRLVGDPAFPAGVVLSEADIAFRRKNFPLARQKLAAAAPAFQDPHTDLFERQRLARLQKLLPH